LPAYTEEDLQRWLDEFRKYCGIHFSTHLRHLPVGSTPLTGVGAPEDQVLHSDEIAAKLDKVKHRAPQSLTWELLTDRDLLASYWLGDRSVTIWTAQCTSWKCGGRHRSAKT